MMAPALLAISVVIFYPLLFAAFYSFRRIRPDFVGDWVAFANYGRLLGDASFRDALATTSLFTAASTALAFVLGLAMALVLNQNFRGRSLVRVAFLFSWVFPTVATATVANLMLDESTGIIAHVARVLRLADETLLGDRVVLFITVVLADVWRTTPFVALLLLGALATIPSELYDTARVDGAGGLQSFRKITLPLVAPVLLVVLLFRALDAFRVFDLFWVIGGRQLTSLSVYVYENVFLTQLSVGVGMAAAAFTFLVALALALTFLLAFRARSSTGLIEHYSGYCESRTKIRLPPKGIVPPLALYGFVGVVALAWLTPAAWVLKTSLSSPSDIVASPPIFLPSGLFTSYYWVVLTDTAFLATIANSLWIAAITTLLVLVLGLPAAYALSRGSLQYDSLLLAVVMAIAFFPPVAVLAPMLIQAGQLGLIDTYWAVILPDTAFFLPFAIWLLTTFLQGLPRELEEMAMTDGAGPAEVLRRVVVPLARPGIFVTGALIFVFTWNEFLFARTFTFDESARPVTVAVGEFIAPFSLGAYFPHAPLANQGGYLIGLAAAATIMATIPPMILFLAFHRRLLSGLRRENTPTIRPKSTRGGEASR